MSDSQVIALIASTPLSTNSHAYMQGLTQPWSGVGFTNTLNIYSCTYGCYRLLPVNPVAKSITWVGGGAYNTPEAKFDI